MDNDHNQRDGNSVNSVTPNDTGVVCSWCGALMRSALRVELERMCLICHARMLNDYFHNLRKGSNEKRNTSRVASE